MKGPPYGGAGKRSSSKDAYTSKTGRGASMDSLGSQRHVGTASQASSSKSSIDPVRGRGSEASQATLQGPSASARTPLPAAGSFLWRRLSIMSGRASSNSLAYGRRVGLLERLCGLLPRVNLPIIDPQQSMWLDRWDFLLLAVLLEVTFAIPFELAFLEVGFDSTFVVNRVVDAIFLTDMALRFFIAIPDPQKRGCWIKDPKRIAVNYITGWFVPDVVSLLPVDVYILLIAGGKHTNVKVLRMARIVRLIKVTQGLRLLHRWRTNLGLRNWLVSIFGLMCGLCVCCHWCACLWGGVALRSDRELNWIMALRKVKGGNDDLYDSPSHIYFVAMYWAVYTMAGIGYGDITPQNSDEYRTALVCMSVMAGFYAVVIAEVCAITTTFSVHEVSFKRTMDDLNWLLSDWNVPNSVRRRLRMYFMESKDLQYACMQRELLGQMSAKLQGEVLGRIYRPLMQRVPFLRDISEEALVGIVQMLEAKLYAPDETVVGERTLFMVKRGVAVWHGKVMGTGNFWGEDLLLHNRWLRKQDFARALCYLEVNALTYPDLMYVAQEHPELSKIISEHAKRLAVQHSMFRIYRVVKQLRHHGVLGEEISRGAILRLSQAVMQGEIDGKLDAKPEQRQRVIQMVILGAREQGWETDALLDGSKELEKEDADARHVAAIERLRLEAEAFVEGFLNRVGPMLENAAGGVSPAGDVAVSSISSGFTGTQPLMISPVLTPVKLSPREVTERI